MQYKQVTVGIHTLIPAFFVAYCHREEPVSLYCNIPQSQGYVHNQQKEESQDREIGMMYAECYAHDFWQEST